MRQCPHALLLAAATVAISIAGCEVEQTDEGEMPDVDMSYEAGNLPEYEVEQVEEGEMPDVDMEVDSGEMPEYDVDTADVDVGTEEKTVEVPDVDIETEEKQVTVPDIDVDMPGEEDDEE